jgi:hypothetical protein
VRRSLCCECGNLRTVKATAYPRNYQDEGDSPEHIEEMRALVRGRNAATVRFWECKRPWHRMLEDLKCTPCGRVTQHAIIREGKYRDIAEEHMGTLVVPDEDLWPVVDAAIAQLQACGVRVFWERDEREDVLGWVTRYLDDGAFAVELNEIVPPADVLKVIDWAWREMADDANAAKWAVTPGDDGEPPRAWRACTRARVRGMTSA